MRVRITNELNYEGDSECQGAMTFLTVLQAVFSVTKPRYVLSILDVCMQEINRIFLE